MNILSIPVTKINPAPYNPRVDLQPGNSEYEKLKQSIETFGYVEPLVWNERTGNLVGGHQRFKVLMEEQPKHIEVSVVDLDLDREKALNLALNKISGDWDKEKLETLLLELNDADFEMSLTGFNEEDIEEILSATPADTEEAFVEEDNFDVERTLEDLCQRETETEYGQVWQLGDHLLVCGDATKKNDVQKLMRVRHANLIVTDPPYNVAVKSDSERLNSDGHNTIMNDHMPAEEFAGFLNAIFANYAAIMDKEAAIYVFHSSSFQREFENAMNAAGIVVRSQCIWVKNAPSFGWSQYRWQHEPVFYGFKKGNSPNWYGDRKQATIWRTGLLEEEPEPTTVWEVSRGDVSKYVHPTQKPLELLEIPIKNSSVKGDYVIDLFGGSGSTLIASHQLGRTCGLLELDPYFCDAIKLRFEQLTGIKPKLIEQV
ncbi:site-specific DNA-methyltransferase [Bacillus sp. JCM 19034]|uniref:site-specific DNA-methyltransferase n=1 Tax=Bacillus sp. JCM 19034 TaxID=1481928 RepID=UPI0007827CCD|nr:site-specific DNA-methyltransferase [Bacillus sp. JCM 19034]